MEVLDNQSILKLKKRDYRDFVIYCDENWHMSNARINRLMSTVRVLCAYLEDDEDEYDDYDRSAAAKIKGLPKEEVREIVFIEDEVILSLWDKLMKEKRYKEATLLGLLYDSGCRRNEVFQVRRDAITPDGNATNLVKGKRGKMFKCLYFRLTKEAYIKYEESRTDKSEMLFINSSGEVCNSSALYEWVKNWQDDLKELTGKEYNLNVHSFRHSFIENLCSGTHYLCREMSLGAVPIEKVKTLAHHSDVSTTDHYRANNDEKDIEDLFGIKLS